MREPPRPKFDYDVAKLTEAYEDALRKVQAELSSLFLSDFERAQIIAVEENIRLILRDLQKYGNEWSRHAVTRAFQEGIASTIYSLGLADTFEEALRITKFSETNRALANAIIADTQSDLLEVTQNVSRRTRASIRRATADVMRTKAAEGITGIQSIQQAISREIRKELRDSADFAVRDSLGRQWRLKNYTEMLARTKLMEAHIESSANEALERGVEFGVVSRHGGTCSKCAPWEGRVIALNPYNTQGFPTMEEARAGQLWHPSCRHTISAVRRLDRLPAELRELNEIDS